MTVIDEEVVIIREIYARYLDGASPGLIARELNEGGEVMVSGVPWQPYAVRLVLASRHVTGIRVFRGHRRIGAARLEEFVSDAAVELLTRLDVSGAPSAATALSATDEAAISADDAELAELVAVLVHGGGVTREEGGFFSRLAAGLADAGIASLRCDLRGHGDSEGRQEDLTIAGILADIRAATTLARSQVGVDRVALLGTSFSGGICGYYAAQHPPELASLVMLNPLLNYRKRLIDDKPYWHTGCISEEAGRELLNHGYLAHSPTLSSADHC